MKGITRDKSEYLSRIAYDNDISVILLQETYTQDMDQLISRGTIQGYTLVSASFHRKYRTLISIRQDISTWKEIFVYNHNNNTSLIHIKINDINIINVYKAANVPWENTILQSLKHLTLIAGGFNGHHHS